MKYSYVGPQASASLIVYLVSLCFSAPVFLLLVCLLGLSSQLLEALGGNALLIFLKIYCEALVHYLITILCYPILVILCELDNVIRSVRLCPSLKPLVFERIAGRMEETCLHERVEELRANLAVLCCYIDLVNLEIRYNAADLREVIAVMIL